MAGWSIARLLTWLLLALGIVVGGAAAFMSVVAIAFAASPAIRAELLRQVALTGQPPLPVFLVPWGLLPMALIVALACVLLFSLRQVVMTVERRAPFDPGNPGRLRRIALLLAAIEIVRNGTMFALAAEQLSFAKDIDGWVGSALAVLTVLVLAEAFREGSRLRTDSDLTI